MVTAEMSRSTLAQVRIRRPGQGSPRAIGYTVSVPRKDRGNFHIHRTDPQRNVIKITAARKIVMFAKSTSAQQNRANLISAMITPDLLDVNRSRVRKGRPGIKPRAYHKRLHRHFTEGSTTGQPLRDHWNTNRLPSGLKSRPSLWPQSPLHETGGTTIATRPLTENPTDLPHANSHDGITSLLRSANLNMVADKLDGLRNAAIEDPEVPTMHIESLKTFAEFMLARPMLATKSLGVNDEGFVDAQWFLSPTMKSGVAEAEAKESRFWGDGRGMLVLIFLPDGMAHFAANSGPAVGGRTRLRKSATCSLEMIPDELASFWPRVITP